MNSTYHNVDFIGKIPLLLPGTGTLVLVPVLGPSSGTWYHVTTGISGKYRYALPVLVLYPPPLPRGTSLVLPSLRQQHVYRYYIRFLFL